MQMRKSRILRKMRAGETAVTVKLNLSDPRGMELAAMCGFDALWVDLEHCPSGFHDVEEAVRTAKIYDCDVITRVAKGCYSDYIRPLEADSTAIMIPHLMSLKEAKEIVYYTKFHPIGRRPIDGGNADAAFCLINGNDYIKQANEERLTIVQIEDPEPLDELEEICALPGIDMIFFGPGDFSQGIGTPNDFTNPKIAETRKLVAECAARHGKFAGTVGSINNLKELMDEGYHLVNLMADVTTLGSAYSEVMNKVLDIKK